MRLVWEVALRVYLALVQKTTASRAYMNFMKNAETPFEQYLVASAHSRHTKPPSCTWDGEQAKFMIPTGSFVQVMIGFVAATVKICGPCSATQRRSTGSV